MKKSLWLWIRHIFLSYEAVIYKKLGRYFFHVKMWAIQIQFDKLDFIKILKLIFTGKMKRQATDGANTCKSYVWLRTLPRIYKKQFPH